MPGKKQWQFSIAHQNWRIVHKTGSKRTRICNLRDDPAKFIRPKR